MNTTITVWDYDGEPEGESVEVLCWRGYSQKPKITSVLRYLEDHAGRFRAKYLAFINDLGESFIGGKRVVEHMSLGDGFSFWWMTHLAEKSPLKSPRIPDCLRLMALEEILLERKPSFLILDSADRDLALAIQRLCQNLQVNFVWRPGKNSKQKWSLRRLYGALPYSVQGLISLRHLAMRWVLRSLQKPQWFSGDNAIFMCSYFFYLDTASCSKGRFYSRQWENLPKYFQDNGWHANWVHHFMRSPGMGDAQTGLAWLRLFNRDACKQGAHAFLETYLSWKVVLRTLKNWLWLNMVYWRLVKACHIFIPKNSAVWLWPVLRNDWKNSLTGPTAVSNCLWVELFDAVLRDMPHQKIGLYLWENQGWENALLRAWRRHGHGTIIGVPHTTVVFWHMNNFDDPRVLTGGQSCTKPLPDSLAINGPMARDAFAQTGYPLNQLIEVEALRYLNLLRTIPQPDKPLPTRTHGVNVLILGDMIPVAMHDFLKLLEGTMKLLPPDYSFTFKPHPGYSVCLADYPGLRVNETTETLDRILGGYDMVIAANSTSASVDACVAGLQVIIALNGNDLNLSPLRGRPDVCFASSPEELVEALRAAGHGLAARPTREEIFFLDMELPRWRRLLSSAGMA